MSGCPVAFRSDQTLTIGIEQVSVDLTAYREPARPEPDQAHLETDFLAIIFRTIHILLT